MSRSPSSIADTIVEEMRKQGVDAVTIPWNKFYILTQRERLHSAFMEDLKNALKHRSFLIVCGHSVVSIVKDFNFCELKRVA